MPSPIHFREEFGPRLTDLAESLATSRDDKSVIPSGLSETDLAAFREALTWINSVQNGRMPHPPGEQALKVMQAFANNQQRHAGLTVGERGAVLAGGGIDDSFCKALKNGLVGYFAPAGNQVAASNYDEFKAWVNAGHDRVELDVPHGIKVGEKALIEGGFHDRVRAAEKLLQNTIEAIQAKVDETIIDSEGSVDEFLDGQQHGDYVLGQITELLKELANYTQHEVISHEMAKSFEGSNDPAIQEMIKNAGPGFWSVQKMTPVLVSGFVEALADIHEVLVLLQKSFMKDLDNLLVEGLAGDLANLKVLEGLSQEQIVRARYDATGLSLTLRVQRSNYAVVLNQSRGANHLQLQVVFNGDFDAAKVAQDVVVTVGETKLTLTSAEEGRVFAADQTIPVPQDGTSLAIGVRVSQLNQVSLLPFIGSSKTGIENYSLTWPQPPAAVGSSHAPGVEDTPVDPERLSAADHVLTAFQGAWFAELGEEDQEARQQELWEAFTNYLKATGQPVPGNEESLAPTVERFLDFAQGQAELSAGLFEMAGELGADEFRKLMGEAHQRANHSPFALPAAPSAKPKPEAPKDLRAPRRRGVK